MVNDEELYLQDNLWAYCDGESLVICEAAPDTDEDKLLGFSKILVYLNQTTVHRLLNFLQEYMETFPQCEFCSNPAKYEGWIRVLDPIMGVPTGLNQFRRVCNDHASLLIANEKKEE